MLSLWALMRGRSYRLGESRRNLRKRKCVGAGASFFAFRVTVLYPFFLDDPADSLGFMRVSTLLPHRTLSGEKLELFYIYFGVIRGLQPLFNPRIPSYCVVTGCTCIIFELSLS